jgi:hypothetical protein
MDAEGFPETWAESEEQLARSRLTPVEINRPSNCDTCMRYWASQPYLGAACASVGIEHGKSTFQMVREYLAAYHERGHRADAR